MEVLAACLSVLGAIVSTICAVINVKDVLKPKTTARQEFYKPLFEPIIHPSNFGHPKDTGEAFIRGIKKRLKPKRKR